MDQDHRRWVQFIASALIVIMIFQLFFVPPPQPGGAEAGNGTTTGTSVLTADATTSGSVTTSGTTVQRSSAELAETPAVPVSPRGRDLVTLRTKTLAITVDKVGGVLQSLRLLDSGSESQAETPLTSAGIELIRSIPGVSDSVRPLEVAFKEDAARDYEALNNAVWTVRQATGSATTAGEASIELESPTIRGIKVLKTISFPQDGWYGRVRVTVVNETSGSLRISDERERGITLRWGPGLLERKPGEITSSDSAYDTVTYRTPDAVHVFRPAPGQDPAEADGFITWAGMESKFFAALLVPKTGDAADQKSPISFRSMVPTAYRGDGLESWHPPAVMELSGQQFNVAAGTGHSMEFGLYVGPKKYSVLKKSAATLHEAMYSESWWWMRIIYLGLTDILNFLHRLAGNYGIAIMLLTAVVRLAVFPLTHKAIKIQAKSMAEMSKVKPFIDEINERYKDDPQEKSRRIFKVYQEHNINPLGGLRGCLPTLLQMPVFVGLYRVANDTIDLQGATFLWIRDLSLPDHFIQLGVPFLPYLNILPLVMAVTQFASTKVSMARMTTVDPTQKQVMYMMPFILGFTLYTMPSGLMVYWCTSNVWQIFQTMITNRILDNEEAAHKAAAAAAVLTGKPVHKKDEPDAPAKSSPKSGRK